MDKMTVSRRFFHVRFLHEGRMADYRFEDDLATFLDASMYRVSLAISGVPREIPRILLTEDQN